ncbi:helix-turn-helix transcriptional regulator [Lactobacillus sp. LL6]|nr:helix-turn-helix transcriptional regulator [Lactobacillus sp. LL6]TSO25495.1 helix-turn-helix transcriptional regulator [Lactobacillus sp. LL6]
MFNWKSIQVELDKRKWSLKKLATEANVSMSTLENYKYAGARPYFDTICKIADALGVSLDDLRIKNKATKKLP